MFATLNCYWWTRQLMINIVPQICVASVMWSTCNFCDVYIFGIQISEAVNFGFCTQIYFVAFWSRLERIKWRQAKTELFGKGNINVLVMFGDTINVCMKLLKAETYRKGRSIQMLHDLANDDGYVAFKRAAEDRVGWWHREKNVKNLLYSRILMMMQDDEYWWLYLASV